ncbi:MAG: hypothetical protein H7A51_19235 [Akkermansiaceae bacterium]|nr:hypothetical protein [Akkermansiaceae bacterium]
MQSPAETLKALKSVISIRGNKLVFRAHLRGKPRVWVAKSGPDPRAWSRPDSKKHTSPSSGWIPSRVPLDRLLIAPDHLRKQINQWKSDLIENRRLRYFGDDPDGWERQNTRQEITRLRHSFKKSQKHYRDFIHRYFSSSSPEHEKAHNPEIITISERREESYFALRDRISDLCSQHYHKRTTMDNVWIHWCRLSSAKPSTSKTSLRPGYYYWHPAHPQTNTYLLIQSELMQRIRKAKALLNWLEFFPDDSLNFAYERRLRKRRWHLMNLWIRVPGSRDLFKDCPPLAFMLASCWVFRGKRDKNQYRAMRTLVKGKRGNILKWLCFPSGSDVQSVLRKLNYQCISCQELTLLRYLIDNKPEIAKWLKEVDARIITRALLFLRSFPINRMVGPGDPFLTPSLQLFRTFIKEELPDSCRYYTGDSINRLFTDSLRMIKQLPTGSRNRASRRLSRIQSHRKLKEFHDRLANDPVHIADRANHMASIDNFIKNKFPVSPPFRDTPANWTPLITLESIARESLEMRHCLFAAYMEEIAVGNYFAYAITTQSGARATLGLQRGDSGLWRFEQVSGKSNEPITGDDRTQILNELMSLIRANQQPTRTATRSASDASPNPVAAACDSPQPHFERDPLITDALQLFAANL